MSQVTRFAARDTGPVARVAGFMAHLRDNGFRLGVAETDLALQALRATATDADTVRRAIKAVASGSQADWARFDDLFAGFWRNGGRVRPKVDPAQGSARPGARGGDAGPSAGGTGAQDGPDGSGEAVRLVTRD